MGEIKGFPTIMFFGSESSPNPHKKGMPWKNPEPYQGQRTAAAIANYATSRLPNFVVNKNIDAFLKDGAELNKVVLFTDKKKTTNPTRLSSRNLVSPHSPLLSWWREKLATPSKASPLATLWCPSLRNSPNQPRTPTGLRASRLAPKRARRL